MIIAIDFDGTITKSHSEMVLQDFAAEALREIRGMGHELILWTCRHERTLRDAEFFLREHELYDLFSKLNDGSEHTFYPNTRKILADLYIDDRNIFGFKGWKAVLEEVKRLTFPNGKTREEIIKGMCIRYRPDYTTRKDYTKGDIGVTEEEAKQIWKQMSDIYDSEIAPLLTKKR